MAITAFRLRRAVALSSSFAVRRSISAIASAPLLPTPVSSAATAHSGAGATSPLSLGAFRSPYSLNQSLSFRSSTSLCNRRFNAGVGEESKIGPDDILFEGCDYNHWLITMDFPKDPAPTREEMIETYVQTLAKVVGSVEEAKKRMYACSTTTYHGFQAVMTEEMSEKFHGLPGVVFVLPDSYIDPVNKEYGGDKYDNGVITPRPPPVQYNRSRPRNQNRFDRPNYDRPPPQGNPPYGQQGQMQGDGRHNAPTYNYAQPGQEGRGYGEPNNGVAPSMERRDFGQVGQRNYPPPGGRDNYQGERRSSHSSYQSDGNFKPQEPRSYSHGPGGDNTLAGPSSYQGERRDPHMVNQRDGPFHHDQNNYFQGSGYRDNRQVSGPHYDSGYKQQPGPSHRGGNGEDMSTNYSGNHTQSEPRYAGESWQGSGSAYNQGYSGPQEGQTGPWQGRQ